MKRLSEYNPDPILIKKRHSHFPLDSSRLKSIKEKVHYKQSKGRYNHVEARFLDAKRSQRDSVTPTEEPSHARRPSRYHAAKRRATEPAKDLEPLYGASQHSSRQSPQGKRHYENPFSARNTHHDNDDSDFIMSDNESIEPERAEENDVPNMMTLTEPMRLEMPSMREYDAYSPVEGEILAKRNTHPKDASAQFNGPTPSLHSPSPLSHYPSNDDSRSKSPTKNRRQSQPSVFALKTNGVTDAPHDPYKSKPKPFRPRKLAPPATNSFLHEPHDPAKLRTSLNLVPLHQETRREIHKRKKKQQLQNAYSARNAPDHRPIDHRPLSIADMRRKSNNPNARRALKRSPQTAPTKSRKLRLLNIKKDLETREREKRFLLQKIQEQERQHQLKLQVAIESTKQKAESQLQEFMDAYKHDLRRDLEHIRQRQPHLLLSETPIPDQDHTSRESALDHGESPQFEFPLNTQRKPANILLVDIVHIPASVEQQMIRLLKHYQSMCINEISNHEGTLTNTMGNSMMAVFDGEQMQECITCAVQIVTRLNEELNAIFHLGEEQNGGESSRSENKDGSLLPPLKGGAAAKKSNPSTARRASEMDKIHLGATICRGNLQRVSHSSFVGRVLQKTHLIGMHVPLLKYKLLMDEEFFQQLRSTLSSYASRSLNVGTVHVLSQPVRLHSLLDHQLHMDFLPDEYSLNDGMSYSPSSPRRKFGFGSLGRIFKLSASTEKRRHSSVMP